MYNFINSNIELISLLISSISIIVSILVAFVTYLNLRAFKYSIFEENRAQILFYIEKPTPIGYTLILKNFGKSVGRVLEIKLDPPLEYDSNLKQLLLPTDFTNIVLAPNQSIKTYFRSDDKSIDEINVYIKYETCKKVFEESYKVNIKLLRNLVFSANIPKDEVSGLNHINQTLLSILHKLP